jgi:hypothetical protein
MIHGMKNAFQLISLSSHGLLHRTLALHRRHQHQVLTVKKAANGKEVKFQQPVMQKYMSELKPYWGNQKLATASGRLS